MRLKFSLKYGIIYILGIQIAFIFHSGVISRMSGKLYLFYMGERTNLLCNCKPIINIWNIFFWNIATLLQIIRMTSIILILGSVDTWIWIRYTYTDPYLDCCRVTQYRWLDCSMVMIYYYHVRINPLVTVD